MGLMDKPDVCAVTRRVYAAPSRITNPDHDPSEDVKHHAPPQPSYPDIFFAVEDWRDAFQAVVRQGG